MFFLDHFSDAKSTLRATRGSHLQMAILYVVHIFGPGYRQFPGPNDIGKD